MAGSEVKVHQLVFADKATFRSAINALGHDKRRQTASRRLFGWCPDIVSGMDDQKRAACPRPILSSRVSGLDFIVSALWPGSIICASPNFFHPCLTSYVLRLTSYVLRLTSYVLRGSQDLLCAAIERIAQHKTSPCMATRHHPESDPPFTG